MLPLPFVARLRAVRLLRQGARAVVPVEGAELRELLARREELLVAEERAAVQAALEAAGPGERADLERLLGQGGTVDRTPGSGSMEG